jgi:hypothetical protein
VKGETLAFLAGWLLRAAALSLLLAGVGRLRVALAAGFDPWLLLWLLPVAAGLGVFKARRAMGPVLARNARRLLAMDTTPPWRIFPIGLLLLIASMVGTMALLSALVGDSPWGAALLAAVDLAVALALVVAAPAQGPLLPPSRS